MDAAFPSLPPATGCICRGFKAGEDQVRSGTEPENRVKRSRKRSGIHPDPGSSGEPMKQTDGEVDEALAHIRRTTAAPIQRFLDSIAAARSEETTSRQNGLANGPSRPGRSGMAKRPQRFLEGLGFLLKRALCMKSLARIIGRIHLRG